MENVKLRKMSEKDFDIYFQDKVERYADVLSQNIHELGEETSKKAIKQLNNLLPNGLLTPNHHLFNIYTGEQIAGYVWIKIEVEKKSAFLYEIYIFKELRGRGLGTKIMDLIEGIIRQKGVRYFKLHVFGSNTGARKLYEELGFEIAGINMLKELEEKVLS
jgi:ribosomal protein S18 acetylase RimI-like enzyme